jgi:hypothetical protein
METTPMEDMINNLINGNLKDAKRQAVEFGIHQIQDALICDYGYSPLKAWTAAAYLTTGEGFQAYCDAE